MEKKPVISPGIARSTAAVVGQRMQLGLSQTPYPTNQNSFHWSSSVSRIQSGATSWKFGSALRTRSTCSASARMVG